MNLPPLIEINLGTAKDREVLEAIHRLLEVQHHAFHYLYKELNIMSDALDALNKKVDALTAAVTVENTKVDVLLQGSADQKALIATLQAQIAAGNPVTEADLAAVGAKIDTTLANVNTEVAKLDPAAPPVVLPTPTPTPDPAAGANTPVASGTTTAP